MRLGSKSQCVREQNIATRVEELQTILPSLKECSKLGSGFLPFVVQIQDCFFCLSRLGAGASSHRMNRFLHSLASNYNRQQETK